MSAAAGSRSRRARVEIQVGASSRGIRLPGQVQVDGEVLAPRNGLGVIRAENYYSGVLPTLGGDGTQVVGYVDYAHLQRRRPGNPVHEGREPLASLLRREPHSLSHNPQPTTTPRTVAIQ